jgi:5-dehydro-4-deoxyglucarate dehydratase
MKFDGVLFFPVTPFTAEGAVDVELLKEHISSRLPFGPGGVFPACGTGEFHALSIEEVRTVVTAAVEVVAGKVPVVAGTGGPLGHAIAAARAAEEAGADALLVLPPYLVTGPTEGLVAYIEAVAGASSLPVIVYHRGNAKFTAASIARLAANPKVVGFKDGLGDVGLAQEIVSAVRATGREDFAFFNGLLTAELTQGAYRGLGFPCTPRPHSPWPRKSRRRTTTPTWPVMRSAATPCWKASTHPWSGSATRPPVSAFPSSRRAFAWAACPLAPCGRRW